MIGALASYISSENDTFQPMNANYGIMPSLTDEEIEASGMKRNVVKRDKKLKYGLLSERALKVLQKID